MDKIPADEVDAYACISLNRYNLSRFLEEFHSAVRLFEFLERGGGPPSVGVFGGQFIKFRMIAARDGALNIYHFRCSLDAVRKQLPTCPTLAKTTDCFKLRSALRKFDEYFPHAESVRHAVAHTGELNRSPARMRQQKQRIGHVGVGFASGAGSLLLDALYERTFSVGIKGGVFSVTLDATSIEKLGEIIRLVDDAFAAPSAAPQPKSEN
jgi:hypothetical protein